MTMAENEASHRRKQEEKALDANIRNNKSNIIINYIGQGATILAIFIFIGVLIYLNITNPTILITMGTALLSALVVIVKVLLPSKKK